MRQQRMAEGLVVKEMVVKVMVGLEMKVVEKAAGGSGEKQRVAGLVEVETVAGFEVEVRAVVRKVVVV